MIDDPGDDTLMQMHMRVVVSIWYQLVSDLLRI